MSDEPRDQPDGTTHPTAPDSDQAPAAGPSDGSPANPTPAADGPGAPDVPADAAVDDSRTDFPRTDGSRTDVSAPWERPRRWERSGPSADRVDSLLARLSGPDGEDGTDGEPDTRRGRRRNNDGEALPADASIAALGEPDRADLPGSATPTDATPADATPAGTTPDGTTPDGTTPEDATSGGDRSAADPTTPDAAASGELGTTAAASVPATDPLVDQAVPQSTPEAVDGEPDEEAAPSGADDHPAVPSDDEIGGDTDPLPRSGSNAADLAEASSIRAALDRQAGVRPPSATAAGTAAPTRTGSASRKKAARRAGVAPAVAGAAVAGPAAAGTSLIHGSAPRRHRGWIYAGRTVAALVAFCTLLGVGVEWKIKDRAEVGLESHAIVGALPTADPSISTARTTPMVVTNSQGVMTTKAAPPKTVYKPENILLLGSDTRAGGNAAIGGSDESTSGVANSDTLMVAHISGDREHVTVLSIPRDTIITTPACRAWSLETGKFTEATASVHGGTYSHINTLYAVGGPECTAAGVQSLTGLGITRIIGIDFDGFKAMVDALGGITVNVCRPIQDAVLGTVVAAGGVQVIKGAQAISLVRARDVIGDTQSDLARIRRQQVVLSAILRQVTQAGTLLNPGKLDGFLQAFVNNTFTLNVKLEDLITLAGSLGTLDPSRVTFYTLPTVPSTTIDGALDVDKPKALPVFDDLINDLPLPGEVTTPAKPKPTTAAPTTGANSLKLTVAPAKVSVELYNVSGRANVAGMAQQEMNAAGFSIGDEQLFKPDRTQTATLVQFAPANRAAALTVAAALPGSTLVVIPGLGNTVHVQLGSSFAGVVKTVAVGQQAPASLSTAVSTGASVAPSTTSSTASTALSSVNAAAGTCA